MNKFKILVCEDNLTDQRNMLLYVAIIRRGLPDVEISCKIVNFEDTYPELNNTYDLLVLDLGDEVSKANAGENILMHNKEILKIPTLVYTGTADSFGWEYKTKKSDYPFLVEKLTKIHNSGDNLTTFIKGYIIVENSIKKYILYNPYDDILKLSIKVIGEGNFNYILHKIHEKYGGSEITVYPMTSGLSGAVLFKLQIGNSVYILKLSNEMEKLREEHEHAKSLYNQFPSHLINYVVPEEYESFDKSVLGFLIKNVDNAQTLFDFLKGIDSHNLDKIITFLDRLYLESNSLLDFIKNNRGQEVYWPSIFDKIDESKILQARKSFNELLPILVKYYEQFDFDDLRRVCIYHNYRNLNSNVTLGKDYSTQTVLSHGDFHSKNILVQASSRPVIIDTGSIRQQHWCLDLSRLVVHLFSNGIDQGSVDFFELSSLPHNLSMVDEMVEAKAISLDGQNDNFITAINWLLANRQTIYGDVNLFELQLGLMKEFLQVSYRVDTMPPSKRAIALIAAHKCLLAASNNIKDRTS